MTAILQWFPLLNLLVLPLAWGFKRHLDRFDKLATRVALHDQLLNQIQTICQYRHPDGPTRLRVLAETDGNG